MLNQNLGATVAWQSSNNNAEGPVTALEALNTRTSTWTNVPVISSYEYVNNANGSTYSYGYQKLTITDGTAVVTKQLGITITVSGTSRARLITGQEAATIMNDTVWNQSTYTGNAYAPDWMKVNLNSSAVPYGYWTLSARADTSVNVWVVRFVGSLYGSAASTSATIGVRPVIEIPKLKIQ